MRMRRTHRIPSDVPALSVSETLTVEAFAEQCLDAVLSRYRADAARRANGKKAALTPGTLAQKRS